MTACLLLLGAPPTSAQTDPPESLPPDPERRLVFDADTVDLGEDYQYGVVEHRFEFHNQSETNDVVILSVDALTPPGRAEYEPRRVPPGSNGFIRVYQPLGGKAGRSSFHFVVETDDPLFPRTELVMRVFIQSAYDDEMPLVNFGDVDRSTGKSMKLEISSRETDDLSVVRVIEQPAFVAIPELPAGGDGQRVELEFQLLPGAPMGLIGGAVHVQTDLPHQRDYLIQVHAKVSEDVVPDQNPLLLGATRVGEGITREIQLTSRSGKPFEILRVEDLAANLRSEVRSCGAGAPPGCRMLHVTLPAERQGPVRGHLTVHIDGESAPLPISYEGLVASANARIRDLGTLDGKSTTKVKYVEGEDEESDP
jgi:hypothetical protein